MDIRISNLKLCNFKGIREAEFHFDGRSATIEGENGVGKSTVFDAFIWLLFGKDHNGQDQTNFDIKTIDPQTRQPIPHLEHSVEAELLIDGGKRTFRREWREVWVKPRGEAEMVQKGHESLFFVDGVDVGTKTAYDAVIHTLIDEDMFRMITNPLWFIDDAFTAWKDRRKALLSLVGGEEGVQSSLREQFSDLLAEMNGMELEMFKKKLAADKKANKQRLAEATANIKAFAKTLPADSVDAAKVQAELDGKIAERDAEIARIQGMITGIDAGLSDLSSANADRQAELDGKFARVSELHKEMGAFVSSHVADAVNDHRKRSDEVAEAERKERELEDRIVRLDEQIGRKADDVEDARRLRAEEAAKLADLGKEYNGLKAAAFDYTPTTVCPTCGQPLPQENIEKAVEDARVSFLEGQKKQMDEVVARAQKLKESIESWDYTIDKKQEQLQDLRDARRAAADEIVSTHDAVEQLKEALGPKPDLDEVEVQARRLPEFVQMAKEEMALQKDIEGMSAKAVGVDDLISERKALEAQIAFIRTSYEIQELVPRRAKLAVAGERDRILALIDEEERKEKAFADEVARLERLEFRTGEYTKAGVAVMEEELNALFRVARWKMFDRTQDGGLVEMCEVTNENGVPFRSMNDAKKTLCGMDVIRVFSERYDCYAPIFIDNAESITRREFDTPAQVIRLVVSEGKDLTMIANE